MGKQHNVDIAIIGTGTSGMTAYREAKKFTNSIALIEGGDYGTTCARVGCMPSKLMIAPAEAVHRLGVLSEFGIELDGHRVDGKRVMDRVKRERDRFVGFVQDSVEEFDAAHRIQAMASFKDDHTLLLSNGNEVHADRIIIATGSSPFIPGAFSAVADRVVTTDDVFYWDDLPESIAVFGAGVIGLELGQALHRLGVRVHVFGRNNKVGPLQDPEMSAYALKVFSEEFPFHSNGEIDDIAMNDDTVQISFRHAPGEESQTETFDHLLAATGRTPNIDSLGLENTSLELNVNGVPLYDPTSMQCGDSHIFIAGDVNADFPILHEAADEGRLAGENAGHFPEVYRRARKTHLGVVFTDPQIATVGQRYNALKDSGRAFCIGEASFEDQGRSRVMLMNKGMIRLYGDFDSGCLLGAEMFGPHHEHLAHLLAWAIQARMTVDDMLRMPVYHPVIEEGLRTGLRKLNKALGMGPQPPLRCIDCGAGS